MKRRPVFRSLRENESLSQTKIPWQGVQGVVQGNLRVLRDCEDRWRWLKRTNMLTSCRSYIARFSHLVTSRFTQRFVLFDAMILQQGVALMAWMHVTYLGFCCLGRHVLGVEWILYRLEGRFPFRTTLQWTLSLMCCCLRAFQGSLEPSLCHHRNISWTTIETLTSCLSRVSDISMYLGAISPECWLSISCFSDSPS